MAKFNLLVRLNFVAPATLNQLIGCLEDQTLGDWELILVSGESNAMDQQRAAGAAAANPKIRAVTRPDNELIQWSATGLLPTLTGEWIGFLRQQDLLVPAALAEVAAAISSNPLAKVVYTDEEARSQHGHITLRFQKGAINPMRLRTQEYLRDLTVVQTAWLTSLGGYQRLASDWPGHDLYLRTLEAAGPQAFVNVPLRLYQRFRNHMELATDPRRRNHIMGYDLWSIRQHLTRLGLPGQTIQRMGTAEIDYAFPRRSPVTLIVTAPTERHAEIRQQLETASYQPFEVLWRSNLAQDPVGLNALVRLMNTPHVAILQGVPINPDWLAHLADHALLPGVGAIGSRLMTPIQLTQPGLIRWRFEGWDWNTRGRFNELAVPHQVSAVSPHCLLIDVQQFLTAGGFGEAYPTLYAMDLCLRLDAAGLANLVVPASQVMLETAASVPANEEAAFNLSWSGWSCRFGLHL